MIHQAIATFDNKTGTFSKPTFWTSDAEAIRSFTDAVLDSSTHFAKHPGDYSMYNLGEYDDQSAEMRPCKPRHICNASTLVAAAQQSEG